DFKVFFYIATHYENDVNVSYFDASGVEMPPYHYHILSGNVLELPVNYPLMQVDTASDGTTHKSCHIKSRYPVTVYYLSVGACAGGSYLALPVISLGKNYVAASYNDNPLVGSTAGINNFYYPATYDYAGGEFMVVGTEDLTNVKITPTTTTVTGHPGSNTGAPHPYTIQLNRGECYLVRSNGRNEDNDMSGSLIEATRPVAVISGHENAMLGGANPYSIEARDFMVEQMVPIDYWDSTGYIGVPFAEPSPPGVEGHGDTYRIYAFDSTTVQAHLDVQGVSGGFDQPTRRLLAPPQTLDVTTPVEAYTTNGKRISLMQYDERSQTTTIPWLSPSMMTIVPKSRWRTSCAFAVPGGNTIDDGGRVPNYIYINVIAPNLGNISLSINGANPVPLTSLSRIGQFSNFSSNYPTLRANQYRFTSFFNSASNYFLSSPDPFVVYYYGIRDFSPHPGYEGDPTHVNFMQEYSAPAGMQLNTGVTPSFIVDTSSTCSGWHICVRDTGKNDPGLKAVILIDDPDAVYWQQPGAKFSNVTFDSASADFADGELHPHFQSSGSYCFDVNFLSPLQAASAPLAIVDNLGNAVILRLDRSASALKLTTSLPTSARADSIVFPVKTIGQQICTTFVFTNTAPKGGTALNLASLDFTNKDTSFKIGAVTPSLPHLLAAGDSLLVQVCYTPSDSSRHRDSLVMHTDCFSIPISLDAHGSTGLILASDLDFGPINTGDTLCKQVQIKNVGSAPFNVTGFVLPDSIDFSVTTTLPFQIKPGGTALVTICFHPQIEGPYNAGIDWTTDLEASFAHSVKNHSALTGTASPKAGVKMQASASEFTIHPNPANGNSVIVTIGGAGSRLDREATTLTMFDVLGREVYHENIPAGISQAELPIRNLSEGIYYIQLATSSGSLTKKFVKTK
ncbi:MAG: choice-of-anchor D domain-containing protein, partial [Bacteroidota bacterium]|nr:choice-of-anchor D domain-containing protein [Bacteroidota bacterium]